MTGWRARQGEGDAQETPGPFLHLARVLHRSFTEQETSRCDD